MTKLNTTNDVDKQMRWVMKRIEALPEPNKSYVLSFKRSLEVLGKKKLTVTKRLGEAVRIFELLGDKDLKTATREDIEELVLKINNLKQKDSSGKETDIPVATITKNKLKLTLKWLVRFVLKTDTNPPITAWIKPQKEEHNLPAESLLTEEEVIRMIEASKNLRDKAIIALFWDTGARVGEVLNTKIKDVKVNKEITHIMLDGKTGMRQVPLVFSVPYIINYINTMRSKAKPEDPLFVTLNNGAPTDKPIGYSEIKKVLKINAERAGISKRIHPHLFRHSRATYYANKLTEQQAKAFFGWTNDSGMMARYVHLSGRDIDNAVLQANGYNKNLEEQKPQVKICPRCHYINEITAKYCVNCGASLNIADYIGKKNKEEQEQALDKTKELTETLIQLLEGLKNSQTKQNTS